MAAGRLSPLELLLPAEDHDCFLVLKLPAAAADPQEGVVAAAQAGQERSVILAANSTVLKSFSTKFRDWAARWATAADGSANEYVVSCQDEAEVQAQRQLLDFMHSMGKKLPTEPSELPQLLQLARVHAVDAAVLACMQRLQEQVNILPASICCQVLLALEPGVSDNSSVQATADELQAACLDRLYIFLAAEGALQDATDQRLLLQLMGPLQDMLNNELRRQVWCKIPFELLRDCVLDDAHVNADTETTVLAACLNWMEAQEALTNEQLMALFSRIRFPDIPSHVLLNYYSCYTPLQQFDKDKELLLRAVTSRELWEELQEAMAEASPPALTANLKRKCERWWLPRPKPLLEFAAPADFPFKCSQPADQPLGRSQNSTASFWAGYWWYVHISQESSGMCMVGPVSTCNVARHAQAFQPKETVCGLEVNYDIYISRGRQEDCQASDSARFTPSRAAGWGDTVTDMSADDQPPFSWEAFWGNGSPYCRNGTVCGRFTLRLPSSGSDSSSSTGSDSNSGSSSSTGSDSDSNSGDA